MAINSESSPAARARPAQYLLSRAALLLLEVFGAAGAIWGCSEAAAVRSGPNNDPWRIACLVMWVVFAAQFVAKRLSNKTPAGCHNGTRGQLIVNAASSFVLEVLGGAGACWGLLEMLGLRTNYPAVTCHDTKRYPGGAGNAWAPGFAHCQGTYFECRIVTGAFFLIFLGDWVRAQVQASGLVAQKTTKAGRPRSVLSNVLDSGGRRQPWQQALLTLLRLGKVFTLEVVGAAGAVWGCAEVAGTSGHSLRLGWGDRFFGQPSFDQWRIVCALTFALFLMRFAANEASASRLRRRTTKRVQVQGLNSAIVTTDGGKPANVAGGIGSSGDGTTATSKTKLAATSLTGYGAMSAGQVDTMLNTGEFSAVVVLEEQLVQPQQ